MQVPEGRVVKGVEFKEIKYAGNPVDLATRYYEMGADEIVILDITASYERRATMADVIDRLTENVFIPICVGGGIRKVEDYTKMLKAGADKCSTNTAAIKNPELLTEASKVVGSQAVVVGIDAKRRYVDNPSDYDIALNKAINDAIDIPVIASGGGGNPAHILDVFQKTDVSAALAASIFHFNQYSINDVKQYLKENNVPVRL